MKKIIYQIVFLILILFCVSQFIISCGPTLVTGLYNSKHYDNLPKFKLATIPKGQSIIYFQGKSKQSFFNAASSLLLKKGIFDAIKINTLSDKEYTAILLIPGAYLIQTRINDPLIEDIEYTFSESPKERVLDQLMVTVKPNQHYFIQQDGEKLTLLSETQGLYNLTEKYYIKPYFAPITGYQEGSNNKIICNTGIIISMSEYQDRMLEYQKYHDQIVVKYPMAFGLDKKAWAEKLLKEHPTKALIWIYRPAYLWSFKRTPTIFYNEQELFDLKDGTYTVIMVESGIHQLKSDWLLLLRRATNFQLYFQGGSSYFFRWHVDTGLLQLDESLALTELPSTRYIPPKFGAIPHYESEFRNSRAE